jgi:hypothetical protein
MAGFTLVSKKFPALSGVHSGTGTVTGSAHVVDPPSVDKDISTQLDFKFLSYNIQVLSFETGAPEAPNWFGVSFRKGISSFNTVNIFCHPHPGNAGMAEAQYAARGGNWPRLFRYAEIFGRQMSIANANHITIVPFFTDSTYASTGIFANHWLDLVEQIIVGVRNSSQGATPPAAPDGRIPNAGATDINRLVTESTASRKGGSAPAIRTSSNLLSHVVLSCFSRGRVLLGSVRNQAKGMNHFLREVWDFDGVGGSPPARVRALLYDQHKTSAKRADNFHVPPERWVKYHNAVIANVHGDIPAMLACHAATISSARK